MRIILSPDTPPRIDAAGALDRITVAIDARLRGDAARALAPVGTPVDAEAGEDPAHARLRPDALRALSPLAGDPDWEAALAALVARDAAPDGTLRVAVTWSEAPAPVPADAFRKAMRKYASGICIVASGSGADRRGMTVSAFTSVSAEPPMVLVCLNRDASAHDAVIGAASFSVNMLTGAQENLAMVFAGQRGQSGADRFAATEWRQDDHGAPVLISAHQALTCTPASAQRIGTHTVLVGRVIATTGARDDSALVNYDGAIDATRQRGG